MEDVDLVVVIWLVLLLVVEVVELVVVLVVPLVVVEEGLVVLLVVVDFVVDIAPVEDVDLVVVGGVGVGLTFPPLAVTAMTMIMTIPNITMRAIKGFLF